MADDITKKITIDVEVSTDGQQQINQYKAAFDSLRSSISGLSNPLANLSNSISAFDKDVSKLTASVDKLNDQNQELNSGGNKVKSTIVDLITSFTTWKTVVELLEISIEGLDSALTGGLAILTTFLQQIISWAGALFKGDETVSSLNKTLKDNKIIMDAVNQARAQGKDDAQQELVHLKLLYKAAQDQNISLRDRKKIVAELQSQYPDYFGNMSAEAIMTGKAAKNYNDLTKAIIAAARAKAAEEIITKNQIRQLGNDDNIQKQTSDLNKYTKQLAAAKKEQDEYEKNPVLGGGGMAGFDSIASTLSDNLRSAQESVEEAKQTISHLQTDSILLNKQNEALAKTVIGDAAQNGAKVLGIAAATNNKIDKLNDTSLKNQKAFTSKADKMREESLARELKSIYSAYGNETLAENNHYQEELQKLREFLKNEDVTQKQFDNAKNQLLDEHHSNLEAIINKYNEQDNEKNQQTQNELAELRIKNMKDGADKEKAELLQEHTEKLQELDKADAEIVSRKKALQAEMKTASPGDLQVLKKQLNDEETAWSLSQAKRIEIKKQTAAAIKSVDDKATGDAAQKKNEEQLEADQKSADSAKDPEAKLTAEKKLITDKYQFEIEQAKGAADEIAALEAKKNVEIQALTDKATAEKNATSKKAAEDLEKYELQEAKKLSEDAFSIISQSIKQASEAKIAGLEQDKEVELNNSALTSSQKMAIEQKYKQQEAQVKIKAFKEEQEASIAQAVINGALAITKGTAQTGILATLYIPTIIAETAIQVAKIAAQKPPAYAAGGLHYTSDGRGGLLPGYSRTDNMNAYLRSGEGIVVSEAMQVPWARNLVSAINVGFGGRDFSMTNPGRGYAVGGIFTDGGDANRYYNQPVHDQKNLANSIAYQMINNFPPVYVDVKDINNQQNILAQTINRVNL